MPLIVQAALLLLAGVGVVAVALTVRWLVDKLRRGWWR